STGFSRRYSCRARRLVTMVLIPGSGMGASRVFFVLCCGRLDEREGGEVVEDAVVVEVVHELVEAGVGVAVEGELVVARVLVGDVVGDGGGGGLGEGGGGPGVEGP